jgi:hypothetical protein
MKETSKFKKGTRVEPFGFYLPNYLKTSNGIFTCKYDSYKEGKKEIVVILENGFTFDCDFLRVV